MKKKDTIDLKNAQEIEVELNFYAVRSKDGKFLRAKKHSYGSFDTGKSWTEKIAEARIWTKPGPARSQCTWWSSNYPSFGSPDLVLITTGKCLIINEDDRVEKAKKKKKIENLEREVRAAQYHVDAHAAKVRMLRGDGKDSESIRLNQTLELKKRALEKLKNS